VKKIYCSSSSLNMMILAAALQERNPADLIILVGHEAQHAAYLALLESLSTNESDKYFSFPFQVSSTVPKSTIEVWAFLHGDVDKIAVIEALAIPIPFAFEE